MTTASADPSADLTPVSVLGLGAMGSALADTLLAAGHPVTVWNRSAGKDADLLARGAARAASVTEAVRGGAVVIACLLDHGSVHETLDPAVAALRDRTLINLTTTTPNQARELGAWSAGGGIDYLDGGIMAVPTMIGQPGSALLYSGSAAAFERYRPLLDRWGDSRYFGTDAGLASLWDMAMLAGMYTMFSGFLHGAAMVGSEGVPAREFAAQQAPFLAAMTASFAGFAATVDNEDYAGPGQQSLDFSDLGDIMQASRDQGVDPAPLGPVHALIRRQIATGHGDEGFARIFEELRSAGPRGQ